MLEHTAQWVKGEVLQGKIMLAIGLIFLLAFIAILRSQHEMLQGILIPLGLMLLIFLGYGGYLVMDRSSHLNKVEKFLEEDPQKAREVEKEKTMKDHRNYSVLKKVWGVLIMLSVVAFFLVSSDYYKGLSIGCIGLFLTTLIVDSTLHHRLLPYLEYLKN